MCCLFSVVSIYLELTHAFNSGGMRAILSSGQAVVLHRLAVMSKDGDWILRETPEALDAVRGVLDYRHARYRFGAPLDVRRPSIEAEIAGLPLRQAHTVVVARAEGVLPFELPEESP